MGMVVRTNAMAMNANRQLGMNNTQVGKSLEKLSSGFRINRAADDASGLAISEKMKAQIAGLEQASANSQDGISLVQTAEGGASEIHSMLNRMVELATKSANGTIQNEVDREAIQREVDDLNSEITRIASSTNFNGINLLDGNLGKSAAVLDPNARQALEATSSGANFRGGKADATSQKAIYDAEGTAGATTLTAVDITYDAYTITYQDESGATKSFTLVESALAGVTGGDSDALANALNGGSAGLALGDPNEAENLTEFRRLFTVSGSASTTGVAGVTTGLAIESKDANSKARVTTVGHGTNAVPGDAITAAKAASATLGAGSVKSESGGYAIDLDSTNAAAPVAGMTVTVGSKTYEFVAAGGSATAGSGNTAVTLGGNAADSTKSMLAQLKLDGYDAKIDANDTTKILFTKPEQLTQAQRGTQISTSSGVSNISKQDATKGSSSITVGVGTATTPAKLTFSYVDAEGNNKTKELNYTSDAVAANNRTAISNAIKNDAELSALFDVSDSGTTDLTITSKTAGGAAPKFTKLTSTDTATTALGNQRDTAAKDVGKTFGLSENLKTGDTITVNGKTYEFVQDGLSSTRDGNTAINLGSNKNDTLENMSKQLLKDGIKNTVTTDAGGNKVLTFNDKDGVTSEGLVLQVGDTNDSFNKVSVSVDDLSAKGIGTDGLKVGNQIDAGNSIKTIKSAINQVSTNRANLGSLQNRLEHTINNLDTTAENMTAANSRIRDTDMAKEMMTYTKMNILTQAAQGMLAQANQQPQAILQLLQ